jgi:hypothetical protein
MTTFDELSLRCPGCIPLKELQTLDNGSGQSAGVGRRDSMRAEGVGLMVTFGSQMDRKYLR